MALLSEQCSPVAADSVSKASAASNGCLDGARARQTKVPTATHMLNPAPSGLRVRTQRYRQLRERSARSQPATELRAFGTEERSAAVLMNFMLRC
ncbi:MAG: hypothetical protein NTV94_03105 [Planctomycetota bacterium]|nr:hypothetical protein [Planctomycetota bacterium]